MKLIDIAVNDFGAKKSAHYNLAMFSLLLN